MPSDRLRGKQDRDSFTIVLVRLGYRFCFILNRVRADHDSLYHVGGYWHITFDNLVEWGMNPEGEDISEEDITEDYVKAILDNSPGAPE